MSSKVTAHAKALWLYQVSETGEVVQTPEGKLSATFEFPENAYNISKSVIQEGKGLWLLVHWLEETKQDVDLTPLMKGDNPSQVPLPIPSDPLPPPSE